MMQGIRRQLIESGIDPNVIPNEWVEATVAAMSKWVSTTPGGSRAIAGLMGFESILGSNDHEYTYYPEEGPVEVPIAPENISFFRGVMVNSTPVHFSMVDSKVRSEEYCEDCGIMGHCTKTVLEPFSDKLMRLCNFCIAHHSDPKIYDQAYKNDCESCPKTRCSNHLLKKEMRVLR